MKERAHFEKGFWAASEEGTAKNDAKTQQKRKNVAKMKLQKCNRVLFGNRNFQLLCGKFDKNDFGMKIAYYKRREKGERMEGDIAGYGRK